jgi:hypothetical protein
MKMRLRPPRDGWPRLENKFKPPIESNFHTDAGNYRVGFAPKFYGRLVRHIYEMGSPADGLSGWEILPFNGHMPSPRQRGLGNAAVDFSPLMGITAWLSAITNREDIAVIGASKVEWAQGTRWSGNSYGARLYRFVEDPFFQVEEVIKSIGTNKPHDYHTITLREHDRPLDSMPHSLSFTTTGGGLIMNAKLGSSDVLRDLYYDIFVTTMIQEFIARRLNLSLANAYFSLDSIYLKGEDEHRLPEVIKWKAVGARGNYTAAMNDMPRGITYDDIEILTEAFVDVYRRPRTLELLMPTLVYSSETVAAYCNYLLAVMCAWQWNGIDAYLFKDAFENILEDLWFTAMLIERNPHFNTKMLKKRRYYESQIKTSIKMRYLKDLEKKDE